MSHFPLVNASLGSLLYSCVRVLGTGAPVAWPAGRPEGKALQYRFVGEVLDVAVFVK